MRLKAEHELFNGFQLFHFPHFLENHVFHLQRPLVGYIVHTVNPCFDVYVHHLRSCYQPGNSLADMGSPEVCKCERLCSKQILTYYGSSITVPVVRRNWSVRIRQAKGSKVEGFSGFQSDI